MSLALCINLHWQVQCLRAKFLQVSCEFHAPTHPFILARLHKGSRTRIHPLASANNTNGLTKGACVLRSASSWDAGASALGVKRSVLVKTCARDESRQGQSMCGGRQECCLLLHLRKRWGMWTERGCGGGHGDGPPPVLHSKGECSTLSQFHP